MSYIKKVMLTLTRIRITGILKEMIVINISRFSSCQYLVRITLMGYIKNKLVYR